MLITHPKNRQLGFSLIELMVGIVIMIVLVGFAMPSFRTWLQNSQIRAAAESVQNGLQRARAEAVLRNTNVEFVLGTDSSWVVQVAGGGNIESRSSSEGSRNVTVTALAADSLSSASKITFNNLGGVGNNVPTSPTLRRVDLAAPGGSQNLRVTIGVGGNARMCDPNASPPNPRAC